MANHKARPIPVESIPKPRYGGREGEHSTTGHLDRNDRDGRPLFVTDATHDRAASIFDGVVVRARELGFELTNLTEGLRRGTLLVKGGHFIQVYIRETTRRQPVAESWPKNVYVPRGQLAFHIAEPGHTATQWIDGRRKLEDRLDDIVAGIEAQHAHMVERDQRRAEEDRVRAAEAKRAEQLRQQQEAEKARFDLLVRQVESWELSGRILALVDEAERNLLAVHGRIEAGSQADEWIR
jgi:hypothetical protein